MDLQELQNLIKPQLMAPMSGLVLVLQIIRRNILKIEVRKDMPKNARYAFMIVTGIIALYLAYSNASTNPPMSLAEEWPVQGTFLFGWALATYHSLKFMFGSNGTTTS